MQFIFPRYAPVQLAIIGLAVFAQITCCGKCPLTVLENSIRKRGDPNGCYTDSCIRHYLRSAGFRVPRGFTTMGIIAALCASALSYFRQ